jgi:hypothetical protein
MKTFLCCALAMLFCGCNASLSSQPIGLTPKDISAEVEDWEGVWQNTDGTFFTAFVMDGSNGLIRIAGLERDGDAIKQESFDLYLRDAGGWTFVSMTDNKEGLFVWGRIKREDRVALIWGPTPEKITALIADGTLPGTTNGSGGVLTTLSTNHYEIICSDSKTVLFDWDKPLVFWKVSK